MNFGIKLRLIALGSAVGLMGALIALIIWYSQKQSEELRRGLSSVDSESFQIGSHFKDSLRELNSTRLRFAIGHDSEARDQFLKASRSLSVWLDQQAPKLEGPVEKGDLEAVKTAYSAYLSHAGKPSNPLTLAAGAGQGRGALSAEDSLDAFTRIRSESQHLFDLGEMLAQAHYQSRNRLVAMVNQRLEQLRLVTLGLLALLLVFVIALAAVAYRDLIAPLRVKLVESRVLAERQEKLASLGMLAAGVAHEIRNPLTAMKAAVFIQQKRFQPGSQEHIDADVVQREILRLERIVNDFLRFARPTEPELETVPADLPLQEVQLFFAQQLAKDDIELVLGPPTSLRIRVDAGQLKQVLINLVQNAVDSIGRQGRITLRARADRQKLPQGEADAVILEVADTGRGIAPEVEKRLFDPFFTTKETGTGLGLSIAARIVEKHGGALQYRTRVNYGTIFGIVLPKAQASA